VRKPLTISIDRREESNKILEKTVRIVDKLAASNSNAGVALSFKSPPPDELLQIALKVRRKLVSRKEIIEAADKHSITLLQLRGDGSGIIGVFAASILASTGNDGRILDMPMKNIRRIENVKLKVGKILNLGILKVKTISGETLGIVRDILYHLLRR